MEKIYHILMCLSSPFSFRGRQQTRGQETSDSYGGVSIQNLNVAAYSRFLMNAHQVFFTMTKNLLVTQYQVRDLHQAVLFETEYRLSQHPLARWIVEFPKPLWE